MGEDVGHEHLASTCAGGLTGVLGCGLAGELGDGTGRR